MTGQRSVPASLPVKWETSGPGAPVAAAPIAHTPEVTVAQAAPRPAPFFAAPIIEEAKARVEEPVMQEGGLLLLLMK